MITTLAGALTRARAALSVLTLTALLTLAGCNQNVNTPQAPSGKDIADQGGHAVDTGFDKVTDWGTSYPKLIGGLIVFVLVMVFGRKIIGNSTVRVVLGFAAGAILVYFTMR